MSNLPEFEGETSSNFRKIIVEGVIGNIDSIGLDVLIYSGQRIVDNALKSEHIVFHKIKHKRIAECELVLSPAQLKSIYEWLGAKLQEYEAVFGKIPSQEDLQTRVKNFQASKTAAASSTSTQGRPSSYQ
jgi:hypothetical protein